MSAGPSTGLLSLPVGDVLYLHVFPRLHLLEVWSLRSVCRDLYRICIHYIESVCTRVELNSSDPPNWTEQIPSVRRILKMCLRLKKLSLVLQAGAILTPPPETLDATLAAVPLTTQLKELKLVSLHMANTQWCMNSLSHCCSNLQVLHLESIPDLSDSALITLLPTNSSSLVELSLINLPLLRHSLPQIIANSKQLQILTLRSTGSPQQAEPLEEALKCHLQLHTVMFSFLSCIGERTLQVMSEYCRRLRHVRVDHCPSVSGRGLQLLVSKGIEVVCGDNNLGTVEAAVAFEKSQI